MIRKLKHAWSFSIQDWWDFIQSWVMLLIVDIWLRIGSYKALQEALIKKQPIKSAIESRTNNASKEEIKHIASMVEIAGRNHVVRMSCLRRALVQQWLLSKKGISSKLRFGVRTIEGDLEAHAWLEKDGKMISDPEIIREQYIALSEATRENLNHEDVKIE